MLMNPVAWQPGFETRMLSQICARWSLLRKAVGPAGGGAVGGGGVDYLGVPVLNKGDRLHSGSVGQAQKDQVGGVEELAPLLGVLPLVLVNEQQLQIVPAAQPFIDLQACGALLAVNIDLGFVHKDHLIFER